jgi:hypothetical protein
MSEYDDPLMFLRREVEAMLVASGFEVLDIVTHDRSIEEGDTEWIVSPYRHYLWLSNNFATLLLGDDCLAARRIIQVEIAHLKRRIADAQRRKERMLDCPD